MTEPGVVISSEKTNELESELLIAQRKELQTELRGINSRLQQAEISGTDSQVENLEDARKAQGDILDQIDRIDQILAAQNPDVLSEQAAGLPTVFIEKPLIENESETEDGAMGRIDSQLLALTQESVEIMQDYESKIAELKAKKDEALKPIIEKKNKFLAQKAAYLRLRRQMKDLENNMKDV